METGRHDHMSTPRPGHRTQRSPRSRRVLVADDDREMCRLIAWALRREGCEVDQCRDGFTLRELLDHGADGGPGTGYDLVISDIRMPGPSGLEVLAHAGPPGARPPMIIISSFCDQATEEEARRLGAEDLLPKPFTTAELLRRVRRQLGPAAGDGTESDHHQEPQGGQS